MSGPPDLEILEPYLEEDFVRSSGPGGQNVNKVATAVQLRFDTRRAPLPEDVRRRLDEVAGSRLGSDGILRIDARRHRTRERNRKDARERLQALLVRAWEEPVPRRPTRPSRAQRRKRLEEKRRRGRLKEQRSRAPDRD